MFFYRITSVLILPFLVLYLFLRIKKGKEDKNRIKERFGFSSVKRPQGNVVWIHAVSVGETNSSLILLDEILKTHPKTTILFTTTTLTSAAILSEKIKIYKSRVIHQFLPIDSYFVVKRFFNFWQPKMTIFVESEIWPNLINQARKRNIKTVLVNARMSENSFKKWLFARKIGFKIFDNFDVIFAQSVMDQQRLKKLSHQEILFFGNLKSEATNLTFDEKELKKILDQISYEDGSHRKFWLAASTHKGEEEIIIAAHKKLKKEFPDLLTILVPRHPNRAAEIKELMSDIKFSQRSANEQISPQTEIYLADTLGELGLFYRLNKMAFIGGSLVDVGGHNPFEAIKLGCAIISGRHVFNFREIYAALEEKMAYFLVESEDDLVMVVKRLLLDQEIVKDTSNNATKVIESDGKISEKIVRKIF